ncbi:short-chain dehydrogenase [candidate division KSB1 bacterium 4572_119]|nr:MAG: short-chain dehydrogenase [candidate division KSB1 bacterium 4572_119]
MRQPKEVVLITGCSTGIGRALALEFLNKKYQVYATARKLKTLSDLKEKGIQTLTLDILNEKDIKKVLNTVAKEQGKIDIIVNNAGYAAIGPMAEIPQYELEKQFRTNVFAPLRLIQLSVPFLTKSEQGMVVNIGSVSGILTTPFAGAYCSSKAALHSISDALRMELMPFNIKVITVQPGAIESNFGKRADQGVLENIGQSSMYGTIIDSIHQRAKASQENPTPADLFAKKLVSELGKKNPKITIRLGKGAYALPALKRLIPERFLDKILSNKFKLNQVK